MTRAKRPPKLYFSLRSPYSWLAVTRLRREVPAAFDQLECFPYWDPDERSNAELEQRGGEFHYVQMSRAKHLYMLMDTKRLAAQYGLSMAWPVDVDSWWDLPHLAWLQARREGRPWEFYDAITEARWGRGDDICQPDVVRKAAAVAGIDPELAVRAADDPDIRAEGVGCLYQAYLDDVFGIPYLKWGGHRFWGLDRVAAFLDVWQPDREPPDDAAPAQQPAAPPHEIDCTGGCG